jgi:hypothetical protein
VAQFFNRPDEAGAGRHYAFATEWASRGHEVTVITGQQNYRTGQAAREGLRPYQEDVDGVRVVRTYAYTAYQGSFRKRYLNFASFAASSTLAALRLPRPDVVFASSPPLTVALAGEAISRLRRAPLVADIRDLWPESAVALGVVGEGRFTRTASALARRVYRRASRVVGVTGGIVSGLHELGVPPEKVVKITNGVDVGLYEDPPSPDPLRQKLGLGDGFLCVYVGGMGILHDVGTIVSAAAAMGDAPVRFLLVGQGDDRPRLEARVRDEGISNVVFHDPIPKHRVPGVIASADCAVYSLKDDPFFRGTFPNKNFDYLGAAVPVVLAVEGESAALVVEADAGFVTPPANGEQLARGIRRMMTVPLEERRAMGERGRAHVLEHYRRVVLARRLESVLQEVTGLASPSGTSASHERGVA